MNAHTGNKIPIPQLEQINTTTIEHNRIRLFDNVSLKLRSFISLGSLKGFKDVTSAIVSQNANSAVYVLMRKISKESEVAYAK